ncbi:hypothetical protein [Oryzihumus sp.]
MTDTGVAQPVTGRLRLTLQKSAWVWGALTVPQVMVNGAPIPARWGENVYDLWAGPNLVAVSCQYLWRYGHASAQVVVPAGQEQQLFYAPPAFTFLRGRIGPGRQRMRGVAGMWVFLGVLVALLAGAVVAALAAPGGP